MHDPRIIRPRRLFTPWKRSFLFAFRSQLPLCVRRKTLAFRAAVGRRPWPGDTDDRFERVGVPHANMPLVIDAEPSSTGLVYEGELLPIAIDRFPLATLIVHRAST